ncbi:AAA family ATPase, partial [Xanthomonas translucens]|uniref:AAA family ATPase n=1 Tax=Xanthomonas campestris pv. translucens TaxID=343 RepID=UPI001E53EE0D
LISLVTGSINDIDKVTVEIPANVLDRVKKKILLFDGDQTRFIYERSEKSPIRIQGLSGTGKTELLLHKLKETYVENSESRIVFTCHNRILAEHMRRRIPDFFNFMKVEQQIAWEERLWCVHAWGSSGAPNSGAYRKICAFYKIPFSTYHPGITFDWVCKTAIEQIKSLPTQGFAFDYMFVDESQDFPDSFFELCELVTSGAVHIAGDIFQSIFDENIVDHIEPDYLLSKCYRTDPRTLMFAHALGMGLFETPKLRWLDDREWAACGYIIDHDVPNGVYRLSREPLRRFEDIESANFKSMDLLEIGGDFYTNASHAVLDAIRDIRHNNETVTP